MSRVSPFTGVCPCPTFGACKSFLKLSGPLHRMEYEYLNVYMAQQGGFDMSNVSRNSRLGNSVDLSGMKILKTGTTICGVKTKDGVVLAADTRATEGSIVADKNTSKLHLISDSIYAAGAGISADLEHTTLWLSHNVELMQLNTKKRPRVQTCVSMLVHEMYKYRGYKQCAIIIGGYDITGPCLFSVSPHGSSDSLPFCTMGSGSLNALSVLEEGYRDDLTLQQATELAVRAIKAGILNDLGSGGNIDVCTITAEGANHQRSILQVGKRTHVPLLFEMQPGTTEVLRETIRELLLHSTSIIID